MIFKFLRYLRSTWYFNLWPERDYSYFPTVGQLERDGVNIVPDDAYTSVEARERDLAWCAFHSGYIAEKEEMGLDVWNATTLPLEDEYRFIRKNFHKGWVIYVLIIRLFSLKNPFLETKAYRKSRNVSRNSSDLKFISNPDYQTYNSTLLNQQPLISVIIPTLNRYEYLKDVFKDLEKQTNEIELTLLHFLGF